MTEQEQRIAIAREMKWNLHLGNTLCSVPNSQGTGWGGLLFDPLLDLNACHEMETHLTMPQSAIYEKVLDTAVNRDFLKGQTNWIDCAWHATAAHRAEAWLRVKGLWKD